MADNPKLAAARKKMEAKIYALMDDLDSSGYNTQLYRDSLSKMSNADFVKMAKQMISQDDFNLSLEIKQLATEKEGRLTLDRIKSIADKHNVRLVDYIFMPFRNPGGEPMCSLTKVPIIYVPVRRFFQQMLIHKNAISNNNSKINPLTGQVINEDKTASTTNLQTYSLTVNNRKNALKEYLGPRADDPVAKQQMLTQIENTGTFRLEDTIMQTHNRRSVKTAEAFAKAAGVLMEFAGDDMKIDLDTLELKR